MISRIRATTASCGTAQSSSRRKRTGASAASTDGRCKIHRRTHPNQNEKKKKKRHQQNRKRWLQLPMGTAMIYRSATSALRNNDDVTGEEPVVDGDGTGSGNGGNASSSGKW